MGRMVLVQIGMSSFLMGTLFFFPRNAGSNRAKLVANEDRGDLGCINRVIEFRHTGVKNHF